MSGQEGDVLIRAILGFEIKISAGLVEMSGGFETAAQLSLFGGNFDDDGQTVNELNYWGDILETEDAFKYRSRTQYILQFLPANTANLRLIEQSAEADLAWFLSSGIASSVVVVASIPRVNTVVIKVAIQASGEQSVFSFTSNWLAMQAEAQDLAFTEDQALPPPGPIPPGPADFPDLSLWLDAADETTLTTTAPVFPEVGNPVVDQWDDKSPALDSYFPYDVAAPAEHGNEFDVQNDKLLVVFPNVVDTALVGVATDTLIGADGYSFLALIKDASDDAGQIVGKGSDLGTTEYALTPDELTSEHEFVFVAGASDKALEFDFAGQEMEAPAASMGFSSNWTCSVWWKPVDLAAVPIINIGNGSTSGFNYIHLAYQGPTTNQYRVKISSSSLSTRNKNYGWPGVAVVGEWINLTWTYNHTTQDLLLYQNGVVVVPDVGDDDPNLFMTNSPDRFFGMKTQNNLANNGLGILYSAAAWSGDFGAATILDIYNGGQGVNAILTSNFGNYTQSANLRRWYRLGKNPDPDIGEDFGSTGVDSVSVGGGGTSLIDDDNIITDYPGIGGKEFSTLDFGATSLTAKILSVVVDGSTPTATGKSWLNGVQIEFNPAFLALKPNASTPDAPSPPNAVGGQFNGLATTITRRYVGSIGEIAAYSRALTDAERELLETYFSEKWGVPLP